MARTMVDADPAIMMGKPYLWELTSLWSGYWSLLPRVYRVNKSGKRICV